MPRGKKPAFYLCGFTQVILFSDKNYLNMNNLHYYNNDLTAEIPHMRVEEKVFVNFKRAYHNRLKDR